MADLETVSENELVRLLGNAHGHGLYLLARAEDDRPVVPERETKSVSVEGTYDTDLTDRRLMEGLLTRQADASPSGCAPTPCPGARSPSSCASTTSPRSAGRSTLPSPTDHGGTIARLARSLLADVDTSGGVRLLGVGVSGLADWVQEDLFGDDRGRRRAGRRRPRPARRRASAPGRRAPTSSTRRSGPAGSGAPAGAW